MNNRLEKLSFNELMNKYAAAVGTMTQEQIDACAYVFGAGCCGWNKENMIQELNDEKHDIPAEA